MGAFRRLVCVELVEKPMQSRAIHHKRLLWYISTWETILASWRILWKKVVAKQGLNITNNKLYWRGVASWLDIAKMKQGCGFYKGLYPGLGSYLLFITKCRSMQCTCTLVSLRWNCSKTSYVEIFYNFIVKISSKGNCMYVALLRLNHLLHHFMMLVVVTPVVELKYKKLISFYQYLWRKLQTQTLFRM